MGSTTDLIDDRILDALAGEGELGMEALAEAIGQDVARRTLQRRVAALVDAGRLRAIGRARARRYARVAPPPVERPPDQPTIPTSPEGEELRRYVRRPRTERRPVGYDQPLLDRYLPGTTAYLSPALRGHLAAIGRRADGERPAGTYAREILERLLIDLSWASSRLEGNTYSLLDTRELLPFGRMAAGHDARETQMLLNHKPAIEMLVEEASRIGFDPVTFCNLHALLADNLLPDPHAGGWLRVRPVEISGFRTVASEIVRANEPANAAIIERRARPLVPDIDIRRFVHLVLDDLRHLHEGNVARYGLRPSELAAWTAGGLRRRE